MSSLSSGLNYVLKNSLGIDLEEQQQRQEFIKNLDDKFNTDKAAREAAATQAQAKYDADRSTAQKLNKEQLDKLTAEQAQIKGYRTSIAESTANAKEQIAKDQERALKWAKRQQDIQPFLENGYWDAYQKLEGIRKKANTGQIPGMFNPWFRNMKKSDDPKYYVPTQQEFDYYFEGMSKVPGPVGNEIRMYLPYKPHQYSSEL